MHIVHKQFIQLLTDTSGIDSDKVERQIEELSKEIMQAVADGEAYEIESFGIFSGIGNRVLFIPSKELETEINFKYVGMEPIEIDSETPPEVTKEEKEDPFEGLQTEAPKTWKRDPFAGLIDDDNSDDIGEASVDDVIIFGVESERSLDTDTQGKEEETPGPKQWGIDAHKEESNGADKLFAHLIGDDTKEKLENEEPPPSDSNDTYKDIFDEEENDNSLPALEETDEINSGSSLDSELMDLMSDDAETHSSESLEAGIFEEPLDDIFADSDTDNEEEEQVEPEEVEEIITEPEVEKTHEEVIDPEPVLENAPEETTGEPEEAVTLNEVDDIDLEDFDDPFEGLDEDPDDSESSEEIIPVITNISSELDAPLVEKEIKPEEKKESKPDIQKKDSQPISAWVIVLLVMVVIAGIVTGLGYFNIINIPGISSATQSSTTIIQPTQTPPPVIPESEVATNETIPPPTEPETNQPEEQVSSPEVPVQVPSENVPDDQEKYGIMGIISDAANDGFTIVLYSLSIEANAFAKQKELSEEGYRVLVTPISSSQYGTLWRVSIGQFASQVDAAIAGENLDSKFSDNYFIKKITN